MKKTTIETTVQTYAQYTKVSKKTGKEYKTWEFIGWSDAPDLTGDAPFITDWKVKGDYVHTVEFGRVYRYDVSSPVHEEVVKEVEDTMVTYKTMFETPREGFSIASDSLVEIIGEQAMEDANGRSLEQYIYNIKGYTPENGEPFIALKANIILT